MKTPCYVINEKQLLLNYLEIKNAFAKAWPNTIIGYSFKTNPLPWIIKRLKNEGAFAEVVSSLEYELATKLGFPPEKIIFNGPVKGYETLFEALENGSIVNLDNFAEIEWIQHIHPLKAKKWHVGLRLNFDLEMECPGETVAGINKSRFGFSVENGEADRALESLLKLSYVRVRGVHGHTSTKTRSLNIFKSIAEKLADFINTRKGFANSIYIDVGGCFFGGRSQEHAYDKYPTMEQYSTVISNTLKQSGKISSECELIIEPGAAIVATAVDYHCKILDIKMVDDKIFATTDGTRLDVASQTLAPLECQIDFTGKKLSKYSQVVCGYTCMEMDRMVEVPEGQPAISIGDDLKIRGIGGYGMALTPLFIQYYKNVYVEDSVKHTMKLVRPEWNVNNFLYTEGQKVPHND